MLLVVPVSAALVAGATPVAHAETKCQGFTGNAIHADRHTATKTALNETASRAQLMLGSGAVLSGGYTRCDKETRDASAGESGWSAGGAAIDLWTCTATQTYCVLVYSVPTPALPTGPNLPAPLGGGQNTLSAPQK